MGYLGWLSESPTLDMAEIPLLLGYAFLFDATKFDSLHRILAADQLEQYT